MFIFLLWIYSFTGHQIPPPSPSPHSSWEEEKKRKVVVVVVLLPLLDRFFVVVCCWVQRPLKICLHPKLSCLFTRRWYCGCTVEVFVRCSRHAVIPALKIFMSSGSVLWYLMTLSTAVNISLNHSSDLGHWIIWSRSSKACWHLCAGWPLLHFLTSLRVPWRISMSTCGACARMPSTPFSGRIQPYNSHMRDRPLPEYRQSGLTKWVPLQTTNNQQTHTQKGHTTQPREGGSRLSYRQRYLFIYIFYFRPWQSFKNYIRLSTGLQFRDGI